MQTTKILKKTLILVAVLAVGVYAGTSSPANAASTITVNSTADTEANDGVCTLREAINASNNDTASGATAGECIAGSGNDTINFNITGTADFTNAGQDGYTIKPQSGLPDITDTVTINGYSQPGSQANTAIAPNPLNGVLLVELDGSDAGIIGGIKFTDNSDDSILKGLVINNFGQGDAIIFFADNVQASGNYIGTDPIGTVAQPNTVGVNALVGDPDSGEGIKIGGLNPEDRNLISGNTSGPTATGGYPGEGWVIQGNYFGVAADGLTSLPNATIGGSGSLSIDEVNNVLVGGSSPAAINVIGENLGHGIAPHNGDGLTIEGNYIGLGYDGTTVLGSTSNGGDGAGITLSDITNSTIKNNHIAGWSEGGIDINQGNNNILIESNVVHDNAKDGMELKSTNITVKNNIVFDNNISNINITAFSAFGAPAQDIKVVGNKVGLKENGKAAGNNAAGIVIMGDPVNVIIGGTDLADANTIFANNAAGIIVGSITVDAAGVTITPQGVSVLGNSISKNNPSTIGLFKGDGLGIDLIKATDTDSPPDGLPNNFTDLGPTPNDPSDSDTGPNHFINFPVLNSVEQNGSTASINFNLDAADGENDQYRVEFFSNDTPDPSGYGEGQTFLGATTVTNGNSQIANLTLPSGTNLADKSISATTTAIDSNATSGFGSTSEFSQIVTATQVLTPSPEPTIPTSTPTSSTSNPTPITNLASTGDNLKLLFLIASLLLLGGLGMLAKKHLPRTKSYNKKIKNTKKK
jgi:CSLREA domain-containing protein